MGIGDWYGFRKALPGGGAPRQAHPGADLHHGRVRHVLDGGPRGPRCPRRSNQKGRPEGGRPV